MPTFPRRSSLSLLAAWVFTAALATSLTAQDDWQQVTIPNDWKSGMVHGTSVYRCWAELPQAWEDRRIDCFLEAGDDARELWVNGNLVATIGSMPPEYQSGLGTAERYEIPHDSLLFGKPNLIELRIVWRGGRQNLNLAAPAVFAEQFAIHLSGTWQKQATEELSGSVEPQLKVFTKVESAADVLPRLQRLAGEIGPLAPQDALEHMTPADGLAVELVLADPIIGQPLHLDWDARGRLWVAEYRQYPDPAGLKVVSRDPFLRTVYDRVPAAPPHHDRGKDRISIHTDTDGDGTLDDHRVFVDGLNLMTSFAIGRGGVFVLNPPYLLFYPDADGDDVPDGDPTVLLEGFGLEDSHSIANSLRWGPDGWLYAAQGSTVSGKVRKPGSDDPTVDTLGQLIWRYHPPTGRYEVFAEGGGNAFGVEIDQIGHVYSGHNGGDTRGFHYVQGGYFQKGFSKHGSLSNPYAFGYFPWMKHPSVPRFSHTFVIDEGGLFQPPFQGRLYGVEPLQGRVVMSEIRSDGSTYQTQDVGYALTSKDSWFRPVDIKSGPDGALYVADFYEQRIDHASHYQGRVQPESGRVYRLKPQGVSLTTAEIHDDPADLLAALDHPNRRVRMTAIQRIADLQPRQLITPLRKRLTQPGPEALEAFWGLNALDALNPADWQAAIAHPQPAVRRWAVRIACDFGELTPDQWQAMQSQLERETDSQVRSQYAASARRLPPQHNLAIIDRMVVQDRDRDDPHIPLLIWWALESVASTSPGQLVELSASPGWQQSQLAQSQLFGRLMKRFVLPGRRESLLVAAQLLEKATPDSATHFLKAFDEATQGRPLTTLPQPLIEQLARYRGDSLELQALLGDENAFAAIRQQVADPKVAPAQRVRWIEVLAAYRRAADTDIWLGLLTPETPQDVRLAALAALSASTDERVASVIIGRWNESTEPEREVAQTLLASRKTWASQLLDALDQDEIPAEQIDPNLVQRIVYHNDDSLAQRAGTYWPELKAGTAILDPAELATWSARITTGLGNPYDGRELFNQKCAKCHRLFEKGGELGPDLTSYQRTDLGRLLTNIVAPSAEIREGYETTVVETIDGLLSAGFIEAEDERYLSLRQNDGQLTQIPQDDIEQRFRSPNSLMPKGLLDDLTDQQLRDLFAYLRSSQPLP